MAAPKFHAFWAINAPLEPERMRRQLDRFRAAGLDGVVFHPRFYSDPPAYLSGAFLDRVSETILHARSLGLAFWLYDENGWPSGTVGGELLRQHPGLAQRWVGLFAAPRAQPLATFEHGGKRWHLAECRGAGVDYLDPALCHRFIEMTYERYRVGLSPEAFDHVEAFFCDEPEFGLGHVHDSLPPDGAIPWTPRLPERYRERHGDDLLPLLPALFFPLEGHEEIRIRFWECVTDVFNEAFIAPLDAWCRRHGKLFTAHVKGEEHPLFQVPMVGSCHQVFQRLSLPAIDALERDPANHFYPRQVSSVARQFGNGRCMAEAFGGAGWGATPEDLERYLLWLGRHGLTDFVLHLSQYRLDSAAMRDWPPSQPLHLSWSPLYAEVIGKVREQLRAAPRPAADMLVVAPYRGITAAYEPWESMQTNIHDAGTYPPSRAGVMNSRFLELIENLHRADAGYDVTDERTLIQHGQQTPHGLQLGKCLYHQAIAAEGCRLPDATRALLASTRAFQADPPVAGTIPTHPKIGNSLPVRWTLAEHPLNDWLLECAPETDGWFSAGFANHVSARDLPLLELFFADDIAAVQLNGRDLLPAPADDGTTVRVPGELIAAENKLRFRAEAAVSRPFVWLRGTFRVSSAGPYLDGPRGTSRTDGPFALSLEDGKLPSDLVMAGFPFLREPVVVVAEVVFPQAADALRLEGVAADAVRLAVDGEDHGWTWHSPSEFRFARVLPPGRHRLRIELIPSTYNACGPHHYYQGDWFIVSPDQMNGVRNFADPPDAPEQTHVNAWCFRRFQLPSSLTLL